MTDRRAEILQKHWLKYCKDHKYSSRDGMPYEQPNWQEDAMEEYFKERIFDFLEYMAKDKVICLDLGDEGMAFLTRGKSITKEQLFENFALIAGI